MARIWFSADVRSAFVKLIYVYAGIMKGSMYLAIDSSLLWLHKDAALFNLANRFIASVFVSFAIRLIMGSVTPSLSVEYA